MSNNRNTNNKLNPNVEVVLPAGGSNPTVTSGTVSTGGTGNSKQDLKNQISTLKAQQKETAKNIKAAQKELSKLSKTSKPAKKEIQIVKKKNSKKSNGKK